MPVRKRACFIVFKNKLGTLCNQDSVQIDLDTRFYRRTPLLCR